MNRFDFVCGQNTQRKRLTKILNDLFHAFKDPDAIGMAFKFISTHIHRRWNSIPGNAKPTHKRFDIHLSKRFFVQINTIPVTKPIRQLLSDPHCDI